MGLDLVSSLRAGDFSIWVKNSRNKHCRTYSLFIICTRTYDKLWIPILIQCVKWQFPKTLDATSRVISENQWVRCLNWKENIEAAKEIIQTLLDMDFNLYDDGDDLEKVADNAGSVLEDLMEKLKISKSHVTCEPLVTELGMKLLENHEHFDKLFRFLREAVALASLKNNKDLIGHYLDRFMAHLKDENAPWDNSDLHYHSKEFITNLVDSVYEDSGYNNADADQKMIAMLLYCMEEGRELSDWSTGDLNVYGVIATSVLIKFVFSKSNSQSLSKLKPLIPSIQRLLKNSEDETVADQCKTVLSIIGQQSSKVLEADDIGNMIDHYIENPDHQFLVGLESAYGNGPEAFTKRFDDLVEAFKKDKQTNGLVLQCLLLKKITETHPEVFTPRAMKIFFDIHYMDENANSQVLLFMDILSKSRPELFVPYIPKPLLNRKLILDAISSYHMYIITRVAAVSKDCQKPVYNFFIETLKSSTNEHVLYSAVMGLREMLEICGPSAFSDADKTLIDKQKTDAPAKYIKDVAQDLLDELAGRSLEKVSKDVDSHTGQIEKLEIGVSGTKVVLKKVHREVKEQGRDIKEVKAGLEEVNERVDVVEDDLEETKVKVEEVDKKTMSNAPTWSRDVTKLMNPESEHDWRLLASRLGYSPDDIRGWATQSDPCMALLSEWYATHKTFEASRGVLNILQEMNRLDAAVIVENAMKAAEGVVADEPVDYPEPPEIFLSYQWGHQNEVKLISRHLEMAGYKCWMDVGQMGGGDKLFEKIDSGIRAAKIVISCVTEKYAKSPNCNREVNLAVNLGKPMIPLLMEKMAWPPAGSMGPIFSEYLFIRFFQRPGEETKDDRIWPAAKFTELLMQLNCLKVMPDEKTVTKEYKNWWIPVVENIVIPKKKQNKASTPAPAAKPAEKGTSPDVFISYQWGKQKEISALFQRLTSLGFTCWMDIHQMGGGDSLFDKIDRGVRGCKVVLSSVTTKYALSANCRREVSLADALKKPIIPMLMEKIDWPPTGPMSMVLTQLLYVNFSKDESVQLSWEGKYFDELLKKIRENIPEEGNHEVGKGQGNEDKEKGQGNQKSENKQGQSEKVQTQDKNQAQPVKTTETKKNHDAEIKDNKQVENDIKKQDAPKEENVTKTAASMSSNTPAEETPPETQKKKSSTCVLL
ncbi:uncharacterized protein LOC125652678 isoform X2 [Ostrea edulis]|uniref:uncharacterized protein LOC125652678 isoform X2 n=1 Tax=Ostrea edulis TaxID=37623 RepID=UPI0024AFF7D6|nr:uncharacterized protein LOC125652678 isoform X2 [Ostrea edulis]